MFAEEAPSSAFLAAATEALDARPEAAFAAPGAKAGALGLLDLLGPFAPGDALLRVSALRGVGGLDERLPADLQGWDLLLRLGERGLEGVSVAGDDRPRALRAAGPLLEKHRALFTRHLQEAFLLREVESGRLHGEARRVQSEVNGWWLPAVQARQAELARLERRLEEPAPLPAPALATLRAERDALLREVAALRRSLSWRLTAPLRAAADLLRRA